MKNRHFTYTNYKKSYVVWDHIEGKIVKCGYFAKSSYLKKEWMEYRLEQLISEIDYNIKYYNDLMAKGEFKEYSTKEDIQRWIDESMEAKERSKHWEIIELVPNIAVPSKVTND